MHACRPAVVTVRISSRIEILHLCAGSSSRHQLSGSSPRIEILHLFAGSSSRHQLSGSSSRIEILHLCAGSSSRHQLSWCSSRIFVTIFVTGCAWHLAFRFNRSAQGAHGAAQLVFSHSCTARVCANRNPRMCSRLCIHACLCSTSASLYLDSSKVDKQRLSKLT
jgi:hypothetical protein